MSQAVLTTNLHDELNRTNKVHQKFENKILLLLLHLVETVLSPPLLDLCAGKTDASVGLEKILRNGAGRGTGSGILITVIAIAILGLEVVDQSVDVFDVLAFVLSLNERLLALFGVSQAASGNVGAEAVGSFVPTGRGSCGIRHGGVNVRGCVCSCLGEHELALPEMDVGGRRFCWD
jgi:hypothetical protein